MSARSDRVAQVMAELAFVIEEGEHPDGVFACTTCVGRIIDAVDKVGAYPFDARLGAFATAWRRRNDYSTSPAWVGLKAVEELGETVRALIGEHEHREGRGDVLQEAAQTVIVLASLLNIVRPDADLFAAVIDEMARLGAYPVRT